ncbi:MAG: protein-glutamate O-methyltransferase CheR [Desulfuromonadaceae bacterium]|nr:protein-glutamate O-methyltransferase CheR [Desulfuromonadaceae bacterium]MDD5106205.1 protein-glutamate O-methyltransferase CheR [Desulfuromonadaceae bacterium]
MTSDEITDIEVKLLMEGIYQVYGYDFREYAEASLRRRLTQWLTGSGYSTLSIAQSHLLRDRLLFDKLLQGITVNVSEMFRDPSFFKNMRELVIPHLKTYPFVKIWHAGCATGEEAYSMAIILHEEGLHGRFRIYATDINEEVIRKAQEGIYPLQDMQRFTRSYQHSGGSGSFSDYYTARYHHAILTPSLRENIVFAAHNLAVDADFGEMNLILCRNVLIYFKLPLKERVLELFDKSLTPGGFLCLGTKESLEQRTIYDNYEELRPRVKIYRKRYEK